jgi:glycosyltransferase involved in cell wall biosynthesis
MYCTPEIIRPGGIARVTVIKSNYWVRKGNHVSIVVTDQTEDGSYYQLDSSVKVIVLPYHFENLHETSFYKRQFIRMEKLKGFKKDLEKILMQTKYDIVVSTMTSEFKFLYEIYDGSKKIVECHFNHDHELLKAKSFGLSFIYRFLYWVKIKHNDRLVDRYDAFVCLTHEDAQIWKRKINKTNIFVIPNMLSFESGNVDFSQKKKIVIAVGRLDAQKGFDRLIEIWCKIVPSFPDWTLYIYGDGRDKELLKKMINDKGISESAHIYPAIKDINGKYKEATIQTFTSRYEGFGLVILEANSCGVPTVSYTCKCGPKDIIKDGKNGFLVEEGDQNTFAKKLTELMSSPTLTRQMGQRAMDMSKEYSLEKIMNKWKTLFGQLLDRKIN